jgi:hypothetical protein
MATDKFYNLGSGVCGRGTRSHNRVVWGVWPGNTLSQPCEGFPDHTPQTTQQGFPVSIQHYGCGEESASQADTNRKRHINIKQVLLAKTASARKWFGPSLARLSSRKTRGKRIWETPGKDPGDRERPPGGPGGRESPRDKERIMLHIFGDPLF